jgi:hypothetical protein
MHDGAADRSHHDADEQRTRKHPDEAHADVDA